MKKSNPDLFDGWNCPMCGNAEESFNHVWTCPQNISIVQLIASNALDNLLTRIYKYSKDGAVVKNNLGLAWLLLNVSSNNNRFTFIDIIKGIVPLLLFDKINLYLQNASITRRLISLYLHEIYIQILDLVWKSRCEVAIRQELHVGITRKHKNLHSRIVNNNSTRTTSVTSQSTSIFSSNLTDRIVRHIELGTELGFSIR